MDKYKLRIGIALENENFIWIKNLLSERYSNDFYYYHIKYDLYSENLKSKIDLLLIDFTFYKNSVYKRDSFNNNIPLIIFIDEQNPQDLVSAVNYHPYDIWLKENSTKERIWNSVDNIIHEFNKNTELEQYHEIIRNLPISVVISDQTGKIEYVNPQFEKVSGYNFQELMGQNPRVLKSGVHEAQFYENMWKTISAGNTWEGEIYNKNKKGDLYLERLMIFPYKNNQDQITHYIGIRVDDTDRRRAEALKNIKELAGGIAHEFSQPLQVITISLSMLETKMRGNDLFARIKRMVDKIVELVTNLKNITELRQQDYLDIQILDLKASSQQRNKSQNS
jgi:PAS domain S-box-containing protein